MSCANPNLQMDELIEKSNSLLVERGFDPMPLDAYDFYRKSDAEILKGIRERNSRRREDARKDGEVLEEEKSPSGNDHRGTKMVLKQYFNWLDSGSDPQVNIDGHALHVQGSALLWALSLVNFVPPLAYHT